MALRAYLSSRVAATSYSAVLVAISYYDDTDPGNGSVGPGTPPAVVRWSETFNVPATMTNAELANEIRSRGAQVRAVQQKADALNSQFPVGSTLAIP